MYLLQVPRIRSNQQGRGGAPPLVAILFYCVTKEYAEKGTRPPCPLSPAAIADSLHSIDDLRNSKNSG